jgi:hypothetical protein
MADDQTKTEAGPVDQSDTYQEALKRLLAKYETEVYTGQPTQQTEEAIKQLESHKESATHALAASKEKPDTHGRLDTGYLLHGGPKKPKGKKPKDPRELDLAGKEFSVTELERGKGKLALTPKQLASLREQAIKGSKLAEHILKEYEKNPQYNPSLEQVVNQLQKPVIEQLAQLPQEYETYVGHLNQALNPQAVEGDVQATAAAAQAGPGGKDVQAPSAADQAPLTTAEAGIANTYKATEPAIEQAFSDLAPAMKLADTAVPTESLVSALLAHQQYAMTYNGAPPPSTTPPWLLNLYNEITGNNAGTKAFGSSQHAGSTTPPVPPLAGGGGSGTA